MVCLPVRLNYLSLLQSKNLNYSQLYCDHIEWIAKIMYVQNLERLKCAAYKQWKRRSESSNDSHGINRQQPLP